MTLSKKEMIIIKKYVLSGLVTNRISMEVEAENLQQAMDMCCANYNFDEFDEDDQIIINGKPLEDKAGSIYLCDLEVADRVNY